jgi:hypothetical protein
MSVLPVLATVDNAAALRDDSSTELSDLLPAAMHDLDEGDYVEIHSLCIQPSLNGKLGALDFFPC